ncbi:MAG: hypothetical protein RLO81_00795, partial [Fulvivirga sp.]|uniref:hypothetical protein n=1 Tax=Fulvivirga sp. TaxID=1931237 RepID=UPI0032EF02E9
GVEGFKHRDFFLKFFESKNSPNVIPIGTSGNVNQNESFIGVFEDILKTTNSTSIGIQDGDIWIKSILVEYLKGNKSLEDFIDLLSNQKGIYIPHTESNQYYFNFWEIENLYLMDELIECWTKDGKVLDQKTFQTILHKANDVISRQFLGTFLKKVSNIKIDYQQTPSMVEKLRKNIERIEKEIDNIQSIESRTSKLTQYLIDNNIWNWLPGKELKSHLQNLGYEFNESIVDFEKIKLSQEIRKILEH